MPKEEQVMHKAVGCDCTSCQRAPKSTYRVKKEEHQTLILGLTRDELKTWLDLGWKAEWNAGGMWMEMD